jgi:hypothetical protein
MNKAPTNPVKRTNKAGIRAEPIGAYVTWGDRLPNGCDSTVPLACYAYDRGRTAHTGPITQNSYSADLAGCTCPHP